MLGPVVDNGCHAGYEWRTLRSGWQDMYLNGKVKMISAYIHPGDQMGSANTPGARQGTAQKQKQVRQAEEADSGHLLHFCSPLCPSA